VEIIQLVLQVAQTIAALLSLNGRGRRMPEQSNEGKAMATKVKVLDRGSSEVHDVEGKPDGLSALVNEAIKASDKFVTFSIPGGKKLSVIAESVTAIWEE
jgi:hypothetical protein